MKNNDIISSLENDNIIDDIRADIDAELAKPNPDYDKIAELSALITEMTGNAVSDDEITENISKISQEYDSMKHRNSIKIFCNWFSALSACLILVLALNAYSMLAFGENIFRAVIEMTESGFSIDFSNDFLGSSETTTTVPEQTTAVFTTQLILTTQLQITTADAGIQTDTKPTSLRPSANTTAIITTTTAVEETTVAPPASTEDLGSIIADKCSEIGLTTCRLNYPAKLPFIDFSYEKNDLSQDCYFTFGNTDKQLDIIIEHYYNAEDIPSILIPSNNNDYDVIQNGKIESFVFSEDTHITAVFVYNNTVYTTIGYNFSSDEFKEIVYKYSPDKKN